MDVMPDKPSIPSIKLNEFIMKTPMKVVKIVPSKGLNSPIPIKPFKLSITRSLWITINPTAITW